MKYATAIVSFLLLIILGYVIYLLICLDRINNEDALVFSIITLAGAFGGLLYNSRESGFEMPYKEKEHTWKLGWISDCAYGIAGGYVVFLILPTENSTTEEILKSGEILGLVKFVALALVGGYGGRSLVDRALANVAKDAKEAKEVAIETKAKIDQMQETDTLAKTLASQYLEIDSELQDPQEVKDAVRAASNAARYEIFKEARATRTDNWKEDKGTMQRTIPIFEALVENEAEEEFHRTHAQLGYALKDKEPPEYEKAYQQLSKAIELRNKDNVKGFLMYEFNRAICGIELNKDPEVIIKDLDSARQRESLLNIMKNEDKFKVWAQENGYVL